MRIDWTAAIENALAKAQRGAGSNVPRPIMLNDFAVYLGCHFDNPSPMNPNGIPLWHLSMNMHSNSRYKVKKWARSWIKAAEKITDSVFEIPTGEGKYLVLPSPGIVLHCGRAMTGVEIMVAEPNLPLIS